jgi:hypothetical protein
VKLEKFKEMDLEFRKKLKAEIQKSKENLQNIMDELYESGELKKMKMVKRVIDELDLFSNEIKLAKTGLDGTIFSDKKTPSESSRKKVLYFNKFIFEKIENVTISSEKIYDMLTDETELDLSYEMKEIKQYINKARNKYNKRNDLMKGLKA